MSNDVMARLRNHLSDEREALVQGRLSEMGEMTSRRAELARLLEELEVGDPEVLTALRQQARRNHELLEAAIAGIAAARKRLEDVRQAATRLETYTHGGERRNLIGGNGKVERRA
ncbi:hypothetical protein [Tropicimonas sediminicola]|uniref:FlgN protein n=1 Tax=Tropicimonas sediminicola TaxID=1031541 RepID=A0A239JBQ0_9RHOB|nr:hypothetical protein [Tropicimonas sediminicola]SNT03255.1 hypothetical protein SAMN05421757_105197 [Tropicimonas sediminicola]